MGLRILLIISAAFSVQWAAAQDFVPPRPPPLDPVSDFEEMEEDMMEMGDEGFRPPPPPPPPAGANNQPPPPEIRPNVGGGTFGNSNTPSKLKFQVVDEFWEKGKKRGRGKKIFVRGS